jgi:hypothetical protein
MNAEINLRCCQAPKEKQNSGKEEQNSTFLFHSPALARYHAMIF